MLNPVACLERQRRLFSYVNADVVVISDPRDIYYFTGVMLFDDRPSRMFDLPALLALWRDGKNLLFAYQTPQITSVQEAIAYKWRTNGTYDLNAPDAFVSTVMKRLTGIMPARRVGWQQRSLPRALGHALRDVLRPDEWIAIDDPLSIMQQRKDPDEVEAIRAAAQVQIEGYRAAQKAIRAGVNELDVLSAGQQGANRAAGKLVYHTGDYQCGEMGGDARDRVIEAGELYVIDAQTCFNGYWADMSRTFIVDAEPTPLQESIFQHIAELLADVPSMLQPGVDGSEVYRQLDTRIRQHPALAETGLQHHGGHGSGTRSHEMPDINAERGGRLQVGMMIAVEPGGYTPNARFGVRLENMFLITENGGINLSEYPIDLNPAPE